MNRTMIAIAMLTLSFQAAATTYNCSGNGLRMKMTLDNFGEGIKETFVGTYKTTKFSYSPDQNYRPPKEIRMEERSSIEGTISYSYYKDPKNEIVVRISDQTLATYGDPMIYGSIFVNKVEIKIDCLDSDYN